MPRLRFAARLLPVAALLVLLGARPAGAQGVRVEVGSGWGIPSSDVLVNSTEEGGPNALVNPGSGVHVYGAGGVVWTLSENLSLDARLRLQQSRLRVGGGDVRSANCGGTCQEVLDDPGGRVWAATLEGQLTLTSVGRINPYFLVGLGVVQTTVDGARVRTPSDNVIEFAEATVTDAGGDVGFGASMPVTGGLRLTAETRVTGSLPGAKENAVTVFPFSLGLSYEF